LSKSLFERVQDFKVKVPNTMLDEQYRMNEAIMTWSSDAMYAGQLKANGGVKDRLMGDLYKANSGVIGSNDEMLSHPMLIIDTVGSLMYEGVDE
jgi:superfamily I DNA and/or RNA helicase